jgi:hypothetical protein
MPAIWPMRGNRRLQSGYGTASNCQIFLFIEPRPGESGASAPSIRFLVIPRSPSTPSHP